MSVRSPLGPRRSTPTPDYFDMEHIRPDTSLSDLPAGHIFVHTSLEQQVDQAQAVRSNSLDVESMRARFDEQKW
jgi:hypothetical protein